MHRVLHLGQRDSGAGDSATCARHDQAPGRSVAYALRRPGWQGQRTPEPLRPELSRALWQQEEDSQLQEARPGSAQAQLPCLLEAL